jgi:branched-chain amino acid transport system permease protein
MLTRRRPRRAGGPVRWATAFLGTALATLFAALAAVALAAPAQAASGGETTATATAATAAAADGQTCVRPKPRTDDTIHIQGCLTDARQSPATAVPDVRITVEDDAGNQVGEATTDQTGIFDITLPGTAAEIIGHTYTVNIDSDTLPEGTKLRNPEQESLKLTFNLQSDRFVAFPIGDAPKTENKWRQGLQLAVGGLVFSLLLAMASLGLSMIFGTTGLVNFAHGELITFGALVAFGIDRMSGDITVGGTNITMITAIIAATIASVIFGWVQDRWLWKPLRNRGVGLIAAMIVSIGFSIFLRNVYQYFAGGAAHNYSQWTSPTPWHIGPIDITPKSVGVMALSIVVLLVVTFAVQRTRIGKATRAVADNPALAASTGINVDRVISVVWSVGAGLAGLSGVLLGMTQGFDYQLGFKILLLVFSAVVLGGLGSVWGAIIGSLVIGIFIEVSTLWVPAELKFVGALGVLIVVLLFRPQGILGRAERVG